MSRQSPPGESDRGRIARGPSRVTCQPHCADIRLDYSMMRIPAGNMTATPSLLLISSLPLILCFVVERKKLRARFVSRSCTVLFCPSATLTAPDANATLGAPRLEPRAFLVTVTLT